MDFDVVLRGGRVIDGTGAPWVRADVGISDGRVALLGTHTSTRAAQRTIDVGDRFVAPGFVDLHSHGDYGIIRFPEAHNLLRQGITTALLGNCGISLAPVDGESVESVIEQFPFLPPTDRTREHIPWRSFGEYFAHIERKGMGVNVASLVGHGALRALVVGSTSHPASRSRRNAMKRCLDACLDEGACGMSTGLIYPPGVYATREELIALTRTLASRRALYATHVRSETAQLAEAVDEALALAEETRVSLHLSHHKAAGWRNWGKVEQALLSIEHARRRGVDVTCDAYPYTAGSTGLTSLLPPWVLEGGRSAIQERLRNADVCAELAHVLLSSGDGWENLFYEVGEESIFVATCPLHPAFQGRSLEEIARACDVETITLVLRMIAEDPAGTLIVLEEMSPEDVCRVVCHPLVAICSDADIHAPSLENPLHPRTYGAFAKAIAGVASGGFPISIEEMVRKMTSLPAQRMQAFDRGLVREGMFADLVVFAPEEVCDRSTSLLDNRYAEGMEFVLVNGELVVERGEATDARPGVVLRRTAPRTFEANGRGCPG